MAHFMTTASENGPGQRVLKSLYKTVCVQLFWLSDFSLLRNRNSLHASQLILHRFHSLRDGLRFVRANSVNRVRIVALIYLLFNLSGLNITV
jgi:hypothetical protein